jgi:hypothetical protein
MVRFAKWKVKDSFVRVSVCGVMVVYCFSPSGCTCNMPVEMR